MTILRTKAFSGASRILANESTLSVRNLGAAYEHESIDFIG